MEQGQRLYMLFSRGQTLRFLSHLDMMRLWERALRRARLPLRYSQGYHPHPRLALALPLAVGMTAAAEWFEVEMRVPLPVDQILAALRAQLPPGLALLRVEEAPCRGPSLMARLAGAEYEVEVHDPPPKERAQERVDRFWQAETWPAWEQRRGGERTVDLRGAVVALTLGDWQPDRGRLNMVLRSGRGANARPETVIQALGLGSVALVHRRQLLFESPPAYKTIGGQGSDERNGQDTGSR